MIERPDQDKRIYHAFVCPQNGLRAVVISDPDVLEEDDNEKDDEDDEKNEHKKQPPSEKESAGDDEAVTDASTLEQQDSAEVDDDDDDGEVDATPPAAAHKAAISVAVSVGSLQDPWSTQGLAHLLEHVITMGSQEFPDENDYDAFLSKHGGHANAWTDLERTCYYCDVHASALLPAMQRLAAAMAEPLLPESVLEREIHAVDSEHANNQQNDVWRLQQLSKSILGGGYPPVYDGRSSTSNAEQPRSLHPFSFFGTGNLKTLLIPEETDTTDKGKDEGDAGKTTTTTRQRNRIAVLKQQLEAFYQRYYVAPNMTVVVLSRQPVAQLQAWVETYFGKVRMGPDDARLYRPDPLPPLPCFIDTGSEWALPKWVQVVPTAETPSLSLHWVLPETLRTYWRSKPARLFSHLLGHEGLGSLLAVLRQLGWAQELYADDGFKHASDFSMFALQIDLTIVGMQHVTNIVEMAFEYLYLLQKKTQTDDPSMPADLSVPDYVVEELRVTAANQFRFLSKRDAADTASNLACQMHDYPDPQYYLSGPYLLLEYDPEVTQKIWRCLLDPSRLLVMVSSKEYANAAASSMEVEAFDTTATVIGSWQTDPWYGTRYRILPADEAPDVISLARPAVVANNDNNVDEGVDASGVSSSVKLSLPERNDMLATDFSIIRSPYRQFQRNASSVDDASGEKASQASASAKIIPPRCILDTSACRLWYKPDTNKFDLPKIHATFLFRTDVAMATIQLSVLASVWAEVMHEACNDAFSYMASMAGLHCGFASDSQGIMWDISGYHHKAGHLLQRMIDTARRLPSLILASPGLLERIRHKLQLQLASFAVAPAYQHAVHVADVCLEPAKYMVQDRLVVMGAVTVQDVIQFHCNVFGACNFHLEVLMHGNLHASTALEWTQLVLRGMKSEPSRAEAMEDGEQHTAPAGAPSEPILSFSRSMIDRVVQIPAEKTSIYAMRDWNPDNTNCCIHNLYQMGVVDIRTNAVLALLNHLIRQPAFHQLRTQEQLGYIVHSSIKTSGDRVKGMLILIQSENHNPIYMDERIESFLKDFRRNFLSRMSSTEFSANVEAICHQLTEPSKNLQEETSKMWNVVSNRSYHFSRYDDLATETRALVKDDVVRFFDRFLSDDSPFRRKLSVQIFGKQHIDAMAKQQEQLMTGSDGKALAIRNIDDFVQEHMLYPVQHTVSIDHLKLQIDVDQELSTSADQASA